MKKILLSFLSAAAFASLSYATEIETNKVVIRGVDKITGHMNTITANVGELVEFGSMTIYAEKCFTRPPEETPENSAFLMITEPEKDNTSKIVFNGWMFSSNPAISAMEHPIYDIWVLACVQEEKTKPTSSAAKKEKAHTPPKTVPETIPDPIEDGDNQLIGEEILED
jgi:hypothetical protein